MTFSEQKPSDSILKVINSLKTGTNKDHNYLTSRLSGLLPTLEAMKEEGFKFHDNVVSSWKFDMDDVEELERYIDNYTMNEICFGYPADFDVPEDFDRHMLTEDLLIVQSV